MSIGDSESMVRRFLAKVPVTTTDCNSPSAGSSCCACTCIGRLKQAIRLAAITVLAGRAGSWERAVLELIDDISSVGGCADHGGPVMQSD